MINTLKLTKFKLYRILTVLLFFLFYVFLALQFGPSVWPFGQFFGRPVFYLFSHPDSAVFTSLK